MDSNENLSGRSEWSRECGDQLLFRFIQVILSNGFCWNLIYHLA